MIKLVLYCFILLCLNTFGQVNLVYNGDFEIYDTCPIGESNPWQFPKQIEHCLGWNPPTYGTSDYFNTCASGTNVYVPNNIVGEQNAYSGNGYLGGFFTNYTGGSGNDGYNGIMWWEYVQGNLISTLESGKIYKLSMELSLAEYSDLYINEIGALFSEEIISSQNSAALTMKPQCVFHEPKYFKDTISWMHVENYFIAKGNEKYITIGNFNDNISTDTLRRYNYEPLIENPYKTYFFIDHVVLEIANNELEIANVFTPNGDGINDYWKLPFDQVEGSHQVLLMNRWGNKVFEADLHDFKWFGMTSSGEICNEGTYYYRISKTNIAGFIHVVR